MSSENSKNRVPANSGSPEPKKPQTIFTGLALPGPPVDFDEYVRHYDEYRCRASNRFKRGDVERQNKFMVSAIFVPMAVAMITTVICYLAFNKM